MFGFAFTNFVCFTCSCSGGHRGSFSHKKQHNNNSQGYQQGQNGQHRQSYGGNQHREGHSNSHRGKKQNLSWLKKF